MDGFRFKLPRGRGIKFRPNYVIILGLSWLLLVGWWRSSLGTTLVYIESPQESPQETIFVSVAAYRDRECADTIKNLFNTATFPNRITVGLCEQNKAGQPEEECYDPNFKWRENIKLVNLSYTEAQGPTYARGVCSRLYDGETYFMQIDSHNVFAQGWDEMCIEDLKRSPSAKSVVSYYPHDLKTSINDTSIPVLCMSEFNWNNITTFQAIPMPYPTSGVPRSIPFVAGGFMFGPGSIPIDVPFDLDLPHLFAGEEILYSARLWTSGYDMFAPLHNYLWHLYGRGDRPKYWEDSIPGYDEGSRESQEKVKRLLGFNGEPPMKGYARGMGTKRSVLDYLEYAGIDVIAKTTTSKEKFCTEPPPDPNDM